MPDGTFVIFTMGTRNATWPIPCVHGTPAWPSSFNCTRPPAGDCAGQHVRGHWSKSAYGPWHPIPNLLDPKAGNILWTAVNPDPSPWVLPNGTICVVGGGIRCADHYLGPYIKVAGGKFPVTNNSDPRLHGGHAAAEDAYLWTTGTGNDLRWHQLWHQKIDDPTDPTGDHDQCSYFPYVGGYAKSKTSKLSGEWDRDFFAPAFGLNVTLQNGSSFCLARRERPKLVTIEGRMWLTNGVMTDGIDGDGPGDLGTYTFIQEVLSIDGARSSDNGLAATTSDGPSPAKPSPRPHASPPTGRWVGEVVGGAPSGHLGNPGHHVPLLGNGYMGVVLQSSQTG